MSLLIVPTEILIKILSCDSVAISDLFHLMCSCREMNQIIQDSNELWRQKFTVRWPCINFQVEDVALWMERVHLRIRLGNEVKGIIQSMSASCYPNGVQAFTPQFVVDKLEALVKQNIHFVEDEIKNLAFESGSLTTHYYAVHLLKKVRTPVLQKKWLNFRSVTNQSELSVTEVDLNARNNNAQSESKPTIWMKGALLVTQWVNMEEKEMPSYRNLENVFNQITQRVKSLVIDNKHISKNREILSTISHVLFNENEMFVPILDESFLQESSHDDDVRPFCVDKVLLASGPRKCHITILCTIYQEVARRMGIDVELVSRVIPPDPDRDSWDDEWDAFGDWGTAELVLRWHEFPEDGEGFTYIDLHDKGSLNRTNPSSYNKSAVSVVTQVGGMINNLAYYAAHNFLDYRMLKFNKLLRAFDPYGNLEFLQVYMLKLALNGECKLDEILSLVESYHCDSTYQDFISEFEKRCRVLLDKAIAKSLLPVLPKHRSSTLKYAVGLVMNSKIVNVETNEIERKICVIVSWDVDPLSTGNQPRPLYTVLLLRGKGYNARSCETYDQDELELHPDPSSVRFDHAELGIHFEKFDGRRFVPIAEKKRHFPQDEEVAMSLIGN
uniref:F-box domain-containing protein n=1 Tax=Daphnia galeata TaxID=27404 RepID=A0A8J2RWY0_9CRUS|nr:unnamed protein product [Daphnia galeata]